MATVTFKEASRIYPKTVRKAVDRLNLEIGDGEFVVLVGPSGCGKSTLLLAMAGLLAPSSGRVTVGGEQLLGPRLARRRRTQRIVGRHHQRRLGHHGEFVRHHL